MAEGRDDPRLYWLDPELRGVLPLDRFHLSRRLARTVSAGLYEVDSDRDFGAVIAGCAAIGHRSGGELDQCRDRAVVRRTARAGPRAQRRVPARWRAGRRPLWGGAGIGVLWREHVQPGAGCLEGGAGASRGPAFAWAASHCSTPQFTTTHLEQFGAHEIPRSQYKRQLAQATSRPARWLAAPDPDALAEAVAALRAPADAGRLS